MKTFAAVLAAAGLMAVQAECPNGCSGHGTCGANDACTCFDNWMGGDCSQRVCPFGLSFVDTPVGDLNHDGVVDSSAVSVQWANKAVNEQWTSAHSYTECSGKGVCNRGSGECECYDGFTGSSCQRTTCPNDCSGHGQCYTLREIAAGPNNGNGKGRNYRETRYETARSFVEGVDTSFDYNLWDADKNQACVCDSGYFGPDCAMRDCPRGADPLSTDEKFCGGAACAAEKQALVIYTVDDQSANTACYYFEWTDKADYANLLTPLRSETFCLRDGLTGDDYADIVQDAIDSFPNSALNGVSVSCAGFNSGAGVLTGADAYRKCSTALNAVGSVHSSALLSIDFNHGPQGDVNDLVAVAVSTDGETSGSVDFTGSVQIAIIGADGTEDVTSEGPLLTQGGATWTANMATAGAFTGGDAPSVGDGNTQNSPCSNRGICDYSTGECACFAGYTREDCSAQAALSM